MNYKILLAATMCRMLSSSSILYAENKPNIVFILADDMGFGDVSFNNPYARVKTPAIDALASQGMSFTDAHSGGALSGPSRYGLLTGRYHFRVTPVKEFWGYLPPKIESERRTIGTLMQDAGYTTACIGKWHLGLNWGLKDKNKSQISENQKLSYTNTDFSVPVKGGPVDLGFDYSFILPASLDMPPYTFVRNRDVVDKDIILTADAYPNELEQTVFAWDRIHTNEKDIYWERGVWWRNGEMSRSFRMERCLPDIVEEGLSFIERAAKNKQPFFLYMPLTGPHTPWIASSEFKGKTEFGAYGDFILQIDNVVERVKKQLKSLGLFENTIIVFTADNGAAWQEEDIQQYAHQANYSRRGQKGDAYDGGHHVPLFIQWPGQKLEGKTYRHTVSLVDFFATFADLTHQSLKEKEAEDSFSFYSVLQGDINRVTREDIIYISGSNKLAIKKGNWKYIDCLGSGGFTAPSRLEIVKNGPDGQLYNMQTDSLEKCNLFLSQQKKVNELKALLEKQFRQGHSRQL
ncbi:Arylsulfatase [bioreactor metagenome]|uniref:Arylsulfatase n=1 Tax=bioreactor metagenome TaxID=1076179 RepID=A0A644WN49_9ZZZZ